MNLFETLSHKTALAFFFGTLVSLLTITNPLSKIPLFLALARDMDRRTQRRQARKACIYAFMILTVSLFAGVFILQGFGISYGALRIAGGLTIVVLGYRMLFQHIDMRAVETHSRREIAFFPLALPAISGPGSIAVVIGMSTEIAELNSGIREALAYGATTLSILLVCIVMWLTLRSAKYVAQWLGEEGLEALTRLMGFVLICIGVQFIGSGIRTFMSGA
jgi:multiple antibiotic resistance protein